MATKTGLNSMVKLQDGSEGVENMAKLLLRMTNNQCSNSSSDEDAPTFSYLRQLRNNTIAKQSAFAPVLNPRNTNFTAALNGKMMNSKKASFVAKVPSGMPVLSESFTEKLKNINPKLLKFPVKQSKASNMQVPSQVLDQQKNSPVKTNASVHQLVTPTPAQAPTKETHLLEVEPPRSATIIKEGKKTPVKRFNRDTLLGIGIHLLSDPKTDEFKKIANPIKRQIRKQLGFVKAKISAAQFERIENMANNTVPTLDTVFTVVANNKPQLSSWNKTSFKKSQKPQNKIVRNNSTSNSTTRRASGGSTDKSSTKNRFGQISDTSEFSSSSESE
jgi:hypothetical protein